MSLLTPTHIIGRAIALLVNGDASDLSSQSVEQVSADYGGFPGDVHYGQNRSACVRVRQQYPKGVQIRNTRQVSAVSMEELAHIADAMQVSHLEPGWLGANIVFEGIPSFSQLPPNSRLIFASGASLVVDTENAPCKFPGQIIERFHPGYGARFPKAAIGLRGVTLWVERQGRIATGDVAVLHVPPPDRWPHR